MNLIYYTLITIWSVIGAGVGCGLIDHYPGEITPWQDANWAQKGLLLFAFGPLMWVLIPGIWITKRTLVPAFTALWAWLGRL